MISGRSATPTGTLNPDTYGKVVVRIKRPIITHTNQHHQMSEEIIYVDRSKIRDGKFDELKRGMGELVDFIEENEPQLIAYNVYFNKDRSLMTVVHVHSDAASLERHMDVAGRMFPRFADLIRMESIDIYGAAGDDLVDRLRNKARMLGSGSVNVHDLYAGLVQFAGAWSRGDSRVHTP